MCRILAARANRPVDVARWLDAFRIACRESREFQGHGWGVAWRDGDAWRAHHAVTPIWEDAFAPPASTLTLVHARSAFRDEGIVVENNMPFLGERFAFAFNGELRGVRLRVHGATGAARLHTLLERFAEGAGVVTKGGDARSDAIGALLRLDAVIRSRSEYVRALNLVVSDGRDLFAHCRYAEDPDYFTLRTTTDLETGAELVCSEPIRTSASAPEWTALADGETLRIDGRVPCCS